MPPRRSSAAARRRNPTPEWPASVAAAERYLLGMLRVLSKRQAGAFWACAFADAAARQGAASEVFDRWLRDLKAGKHDGPAGHRIYNGALFDEPRFDLLRVPAKALIWGGFGQFSIASTVFTPLVQSYVATGYPPDQALGRLATCLMQVPSARVSRNAVIAMAARAAWADVWASNQERRGRRLPGGDILDLAPNTHARATRWAHALVEKIEASRGLPIDAVFFREIANEPFGHRRAYTTQDFGFYLAMQAMGHGVAWADDHPDLSFRVPYSEPDFLS